MDSSVSPKDEIWLLRVCHHISTDLYHRFIYGLPLLSLPILRYHPSSALNWRPRWFKCIRSFRRKTKSGFCAYAITFQLASTTVLSTGCLYCVSPFFATTRLQLWVKSIFKPRSLSLYWGPDVIPVDRPPQPPRHCTLSPPDHYLIFPSNRLANLATRIMIVIGTWYFRQW